MSYGFVDKVTISVYAGKGGDGAVTFHREKFVAAGGPDGGDGGRGGDVILVVDDHMSTLMDFRYKRKFVAANGENGLNKRCSGKDGESVTIRVPRGTLVRDKETGGIMVHGRTVCRRPRRTRRLGQPAFCHPDAAGAALCQARYARREPRADP